MNTMKDGSPDWQLRVNPLGQLVVTLEDGTEHVAVFPVRAFPLAAPDEGVSLVNSQGHEVLWIERLSACPASARTLLEEALAVREFAPAIEQVLSISSVTTPSSWEVVTDRGPVRLILKSEDDIRRLPAPNEQVRLRITDSHGMQYRVEDLHALDRNSRKFLERFL